MKGEVNYMKDMNSGYNDEENKKSSLRQRRDINNFRKGSEKPK